MILIIILTSKISDLTASIIFYLRDARENNNVISQFLKVYTRFQVRETINSFSHRLPVSSPMMNLFIRILVVF